jgi:hypothetical protein
LSRLLPRSFSLSGNMPGYSLPFCATCLSSLELFAIIFHSLALDYFFFASHTPSHLSLVDKKRRVHGATAIPVYSLVLCITLPHPDVLMLKAKRYAITNLRSSVICLSSALNVALSFSFSSYTIGVLLCYLLKEQLVHISLL